MESRARSACPTRQHVNFDICMLGTRAISREWRFCVDVRGDCVGDEAWYGRMLTHVNCSDVSQQPRLSPQAEGTVIVAPREDIVVRCSFVEHRNSIRSCPRYRV